MCVEDGVGEGDDVLYLVDYLAASHLSRGFPGGSEGKESACDSGDPGSISGSGNSPGDRNRYPLQYSCLENSMDREACQAYSPWGLSQKQLTSRSTRCQ